MGEKIGFWGGNVVLVTLWLKDDVTVVSWCKPGHVRLSVFVMPWHGAAHLSTKSFSPLRCSDTESSRLLLEGPHSHCRI